MSVAQFLESVEQCGVTLEDNQDVANAWQGEIQTCSLQGNPGGSGLMDQLFAALPQPEQNINPPEVSLADNFSDPSNSGFEMS